MSESDGKTLVVIPGSEVDAPLPGGPLCGSERLHRIVLHLHPILDRAGLTSAQQGNLFPVLEDLLADAYRAGAEGRGPISAEASDCDGWVKAALPTVMGEYERGQILTMEETVVTGMRRAWPAGYAMARSAAEGEVNEASRAAFAAARRKTLADAIVLRRGVPGGSGWEGAMYDADGEAASTVGHADPLVVLAAVLAGPAESLPPGEVSAWRSFVGAMLGKLQANAHKGGWGEDLVSSLLRRLREETDELAEAIALGAVPSEVVGEAADVANFAMMIADLAGRGVDVEDRAACGGHGCRSTGVKSGEPPALSDEMQLARWMARAPTGSVIVSRRGDRWHADMVGGSAWQSDSLVDAVAATMRAFDLPGALADKERAAARAEGFAHALTCVKAEADGYRRRAQAIRVEAEVAEAKADALIGAVALIRREGAP